ncbi:MAG: MBL fold metallo-hydrolase [SAR202 cluster bacterium]|nr:MBL fold metallo-hydrolase [SAR202 cluster bacterium]
MEFALGIYAIPVSDGANTVYIARGDNAAAIIDAGRKAADADTILDYWRGIGAPKVQALVLSHRHWDHIAGASKIVDVTGAEVLATAVEKPFIEAAETPVRVDRTERDGERISLGGATLEILETPGHTMGSLSVYHREHRVLFTGDTVLGSSPTAISPDQGDMSLYLDSLRRLADIDARTVAPGHGPLMRSPRINIQGLISHRLAREAQILDLLSAGHNTVDSLFYAIYAAEVDAAHVDLAKGQVRAHLLKLQRDGKAALHDGKWLAYAGRS